MNLLKLPPPSPSHARLGIFSTKFFFQIRRIKVTSWAKNKRRSPLSELCNEQRWHGQLLHWFFELNISSEFLEDAWKWICFIRSMFSSQVLFSDFHNQSSPAQKTRKTQPRPNQIDQSKGDPRHAKDPKHRSIDGLGCEVWWKRLITSCNIRPEPSTSSWCEWIFPCWFFLFFFWIDFRWKSRRLHQR